ncbi:metalloregulator ArsR/SmtB family transcription factor [Arthrobacter sp. ISL-95]|uniref:helix-turn-helix transcriptional regulator n=1 Tax=Arthrobacter sp. ISL-95 TaxID=2819116 RepID=UPI001BE85139|nr:transcriptional regulator [Arthrobacter sp. ISL-95]MBT2586057.1 transcriptional regulator [Arthrobacter sp. ISL-95]
MAAFDLPWIRNLVAVASLGDENRRKLYGYVLGAGHAVGRDEAASALELPRSSVSFHLDRLVREGLLRTDFRKPPERTGPGSGRPSKLYSPVVDEIGVSIPERHYDLAGHILAAALKSASDGASVAAALHDVAALKGSELGRSGDFTGVLRDLGYEPVADAAGGYRLRNCPFHRLSQDHEEVVCAMNGAFLTGAARTSGLSADSVVPDPDHGPGHCCARIAAPKHDS